MLTTLFYRKQFLLTLSFVAALLFFSAPSPTLAAAKIVSTLPKDLRGRILIEVESFNRPWYVHPKTGQRYYIKNGKELRDVGGRLALGIANNDLTKIPARGSSAKPGKLAERLRGYFLLAVEEHGELWYVAPNGYRTALRTTEEGQTFLTTVGLKAKDAELAKVPMNKTQIMFDPTFRGVSSIKVQNGKVLDGVSEKTILPLASLTKLMTALVLLDSALDWETSVVISEAVIHYPRDLVGNAATSEVDLQVGDSILADDLWVSMLVGSSNQSAVALVDASGLTRAQFIKAMNAKAKAFNLPHTYFYDVAGLDAHNVSTAEEMAQLAAIAFAMPKIAEATGMLDRTFAVQTKEGGTRQVTVHDRNYSLRAFGVEAAKTGFLTEAGSNAVIKKDGAIIVVLHAKGITERNKTIQSLISL